jgi:hypothetical protein
MSIDSGLVGIIVYSVGIISPPIDPIFRAIPRVLAFSFFVVKYFGISESIPSPSEVYGNRV